MVTKYTITRHHKVTVLLEYFNRSLQFSINAYIYIIYIAINLFYMFPIMLALCLMFSMTHYSGLIGRSLVHASSTKQGSPCLVHSKIIMYDASVAKQKSIPPNLLSVKAEINAVHSNKQNSIITLLLQLLFIQLDVIN